MQRGNDIDKLTGANSNINSNLPSNNNHPRTSTAANGTGAMSDLNATSSYQQQSAPATALRANRQNPGGADSAVAEPSIGGVATPYDSANIEAAKQHLVDSLNGTHINSSVDNTYNNKSVTSTLATGAASVATGAAAADAAALTAAKKLVSHDDQSQSEAGGSHLNQAARMPSYARDIPSSSASTTTLYGSPFPTDHDASTSSTGTTAARDMNCSQSSTTAPLSASSMHSNLHSEHQSLGSARPTGLSQNPTATSSSTVPTSTDSQQLHHKDDYAVSGSMKGREVPTAGVMGATSALFAAPPMKDTVTSITDIPPTAPVQATTSSNMSMGSHGPTAAMGAAAAGAGAAAYSTNKSQKATNNLATSNKDADLLKTHRAERRPSIVDKVKNVFRRRSSAAELDNDNIETGNFRASNTLGAPNNEAAIKHRKSSGLNSREMATAAAAAAKIQAATAAGPHSHRVNKTVNELSQQGSKMTPDSPHLTSSGAPKADLHATSGITATKIDAVPTTTLNQGYHNPKAHDLDASKSAVTTGHPHDSKMDTRPLKEKISAPLIGTAVAGTAAAYAGHRASTGKEVSRDSVDLTPADHNPMLMSSTSPAASTTLGKSDMNVNTHHANMDTSSTSPSKVATTHPTTGTADMGSTMSSTAPYSSSATGPTIASSHAMPAIGAATAAGAAMASRDMPSKDTLVKDHNLHTSSVTPMNTTTHVTPLTTSTAAPQSNMSAGKMGTASALGTAAAGTAAYAANQSSAPNHTMNTSNDTSYNNTLYANTNTNTAGYNNTINTHNSTLSAPATASTKIGADDIVAADKIAAAIPSSFHGTVPKAGPGEEVVWVKTVTTTDYYDTKNAQDTVGNVVETRQEDVHPSRVVEQRGGGRHM
ncbi:unnamed protein product [Mortierella alpina]